MYIYIYIYIYRVFLDGADVRSLDLEWLRSRFGCLAGTDLRIYIYGYVFTICYVYTYVYVYVYISRLSRRRRRPQPGPGVAALAFWLRITGTYMHRRFIYKGDTSTHAQGTDPRVALGA